MFYSFTLVNHEVKWTLIYKHLWNMSHLFHLHCYSPSSDYSFFLVRITFIHLYAYTFFNLSFHEINIWYQLFLSPSPYSWLLYSLWYCIIGFLVLNTVSGCIYTFLTRWLGIRGIRGRMRVSMKYSLNILMPLNPSYIFHRILDASPLGKKY